MSTVPPVSDGYYFAEQKMYLKFASCIAIFHLIVSPFSKYILASELLTMYHRRLPAAEYTTCAVPRLQYVLLRSYCVLSRESKFHHCRRFVSIELCLC